MKRSFPVTRTKEGELIRRLYRSSVTSIIIAAVAAMSGMLIDGVVIGKFLGTSSMAAYGLVSPLFSIITAVSGVLAAGSQVFCSKHLGAGRVGRARQIFSVCMLATVIIAAVITGILFLFCTPLCTAMGARGNAADLLPLAKSYLYGISPGILPVLLLFLFNSLMRLDGDPDRVILAVAVMTVFDIAGDLLVALVIHGGMFGMGVSTAVSYYAALLVLLLHFRKPDIIFRFSLQGISGKDLLDIFLTGAPTAVASVSTMARNMILNQIMISIAGDAAVAALSVRNTLNTLFGSILLGAGMTTTMIAGMAYGEEDRRAEEQLLKVSLWYAAGIGLLLGALILAAAPAMVRLFASGKPDSVQMTVLGIRAMRIYAAGLPLYGINMVFVNYLQGINERKLANLVSVLDNLICCVLLTLLISPLLKTNAVWLGYPLGEAAVILIIFLAALHHRKKLPSAIGDFLFLRDSFGSAEGDSYERSLSAVEDVVNAAEELGDFMDAHGAGRKEKILIPLFVEEMAKNVIEHGFTQDRKPHSIDLRVFRRNGSWTIRIRDDCRAFDPVRWLEIYHPKEPVANIGIRMVYGMAKDVQYINAMQLNNLIIKV